MRLASAMASLLAATTTTTPTTPTSHTVTINDQTVAHHTMVGQWLADFRDFATAWLPVFFVLALAFTCYLLWKLLGTMPRTKPQNMATKGASSTTWDDVAGV